MELLQTIPWKEFGEIALYLTGVFIVCFLGMFSFLHRKSRLIKKLGRFCEIEGCEHNNLPLKKEVIRVAGGKDVYSSKIATPQGKELRVCSNCKSIIEYWNAH